MDALQLITHLHRGGRYAYFWRKADKRSAYYAVDTLKQAPLGEDVYFGVHPVNVNRAAEQRGRIADVSTINCLFCEFDTKDFGSHDAIAAHIETRCMLYPTVINNSGGGYHCYWLLDEPHILTEENRLQIRKLQARFVIGLGADQGAKDLARVLRVPGTVNTKYDPPREVTVVESWTENAIYAFDDMQHWVDLMHPSDVDIEDVATDATNDALPHPMTVAQAIPRASRTTDSDAAGVAGIVGRLVLAREGERNNVLLWSACRLFDRGVEAAEVERLLVPIAQQVGLGQDESVRTIHSAKHQNRRNVQLLGGGQTAGAFTFERRQRGRLNRLGVG